MTYSVVIVEDESEVARLLAEYLQRDDQFRVTAVVGDLAGGRALLERYQPDLLLLDVYLPDGSGLDLLAELRAAGHGCEVMMVSAASEVAALERALQLGAFDFLVKPVLLQRLDRALNTFMQRQRRLRQSPAITQSMADALFSRDAEGEPAAPTKGGQARLPKGIDALTLSRVRAVLAKVPRDFLNAQEVGKRAGVSRSTARRYLEYLLQRHELEADQTYGSIGRPERRYRPLSRQDG